MKLVIERAALLAALDAVAGAAARDDKIPIQKNALLDATRPKGTNGRLSLTTTNMDMAMVAHAEADVQTAGATTVPAKKLRDMIASLEDGAQIALEIDEEGRLRIRSGRARFTLGTLPASDFPTMAAGELPHEFEIEAATFRRFIGLPAPMISKSEARWYLCGILIHPHEENGIKTLRAVATDTTRMALIRIPLPEGAEKLPHIIVPDMAVQILLALTRDAKGPIRIAASDTRIRVAIGERVLTSKLIAGQYVPYETVIFRDNDRVVDLPVASTMAALRRVALAADVEQKDDGGGKVIRWAMSPGEIKFSLRRPGATGDAEETIAAGWKGAPMEVGYRTDIALSILDAIVGKDAIWKMADGKPALILDPADEDVLFVAYSFRL